MTIHLIQDIATPHNNRLIGALIASDRCHLHLWYAVESSAKYGWSQSLTAQLKHPTTYGKERVNWRLIQQILSNPGDRVFLVGWSNPTTRTLVVLLCLARRSFNMWFDLPRDQERRPYLRRVSRDAYYTLIRVSHVRVFCCGRVVLNYFIGRGFGSSKLVNFPVLGAMETPHLVNAVKQCSVRSTYGVGATQSFIVAGSRLTFDKGFDLLILAVEKADVTTRARLRLLIIGQGQEEAMLKQKVATSGLDSVVTFEKWLEPERFAACVAAADFFVQPSRFDAYGAAATALPLGVPVIGTRESGACVELLEDGVNGFLYDAADVETLARILDTAVGLMGTPKHSEMKELARRRASGWTPAIAAEKLCQQLI